MTDSGRFRLAMAAETIAAIVVFIIFISAVSTAYADLMRLDGAGITAALNGKTIGGERGNTAWVRTFDAAGVTFYKAAGEAASEGRWRVREDRVCSQWPPSPAWICYEIFRDDEVVVFISEDDEEWSARITGGN